MLYAAVVDDSGLVVAHSHSQQQGRRLEPGWAGRAVSEAGAGVVETSSFALAFGTRALDIETPILLGGRQIGSYHSGLNAAALEARYAAVRRRALERWIIVIGGIIAVVLLASVSLYRITRRSAELSQELDAAESRRLAERHQLVVGLAHEIRNPLNAIRLNLHLIGRAFRPPGSLPPAELAEMVSESAAEVERLEALTEELLGYGRVDEPHDESSDLHQELSATLSFLRQSLAERRIRVGASLPPAPLRVRMPRARLRQVLLNLLNNAREAAGPDGRIELELRRGRGRLELLVSDSGPGVPLASRERIFEPFFSTRESGTGLGLALVRKYVEEGGGEVVVEGAAGGGARFRVTLPDAGPPREQPP
jgi:signal transduction histidine kinase